MSSLPAMPLASSLSAHWHRCASDDLNTSRKPPDGPRQLFERLRAGAWGRALPWLTAGLGLLAALGCSSGMPTEPALAANSPPAVTITRHATASVLITSDMEEPKRIASISISPSAIVVDRGEAVTLSAEAFDVSGRPLSDVEFIWSGVDPRAGVISRDGRFRAGRVPGVFKDAVAVTGVLNTTYGIQYASATATVTIVGEREESRLASVTIYPGNPRVLMGQIFQLRAAGFDEDGHLIPGVSFVWQLNDPSLGRLNSIGYLTVEGKEGTYKDAVKVIAIWDGSSVSATADVEVIHAPEADDFLDVQVLPQRFYLEPGDRLQLRAVALDGLGGLVDKAQFRWSVADASAGVVDGNGLFVAGDRPGIYTEAVKVEAIVPGQQGFLRAEDFASVVVREKRVSGRLDTLWVLPDSLIIGPGDRALLVAQAVDEMGGPAEGVELAWEMLKAEVGQVDNLGRFLATGSPGIYPDAVQVTARQRLGQEVLAQTTLVDVVITGVLSQLEVQPALAAIAPGRTIHFSILGRDENGVALPGLVVHWSVSDSSIGTIDAFGNFTAGDAPGMYQDAIRAEVVQTVPR